MNTKQERNRRFTTQLFFPFQKGSFQSIIFLCLVCLLIGPNSTEAIDLEKGRQLFSTHCIVCHKNGGNVIIPEKNLSQDALEANGMKTVESISYQIHNGKNGMPAFGGRLKEEEIECIANYVLKADFSL
jgi:cytochrome c6